jgi:hypothetical protein
MNASPSEQHKPTQNHNQKMQNKIVVKMDVSKIDKQHLYEGKKGVYLDAILMFNRDGQSQYGDDGFIIQSISKELRDKGERGPIIGNWRYLVQAEAATPAEEPRESTDQIPF